MTKRRIITDLGTGRLPGQSPHQRFISSAEYAHLSDDLLAKIDECMQAEEPFGLDSKDSTVILLPKDLAAAWYDRNLVKTVQRVNDKGAFVFLLTQLLYTHTDFIGPLAVHRFITAITVLQDERIDAPKSRIWLPDMFDAGEPS